jgi:hypothetical protein
MVIAVVSAALIGGGAALGLALFGGHSTPTPVAGDPATWKVITPYPDTTSTSLTIAVTRESCAGGHTGRALTPQVTYADLQIVIVAQVEPLIRGVARTCQGNDSVSVVVQLSQPIGHRDLVDGSCLNDGLDHPAVVQDVDCETPVRWSFR